MSETCRVESSLRAGNEEQEGEPGGEPGGNCGFSVKLSGELRFNSTPQVNKQEVESSSLSDSVILFTAVSTSASWELTRPDGVLGVGR